MRRFVAAAVGVSLVVFATFVAFSMSRSAEAESRALTVEIEILLSGDREDGDACGFIEPLAEVFPQERQLIVRDASGATVEVVYLSNLLDENDTLPGTAKDGFCVITSTMDVPDSGFYRFTVDGYFDWTVTRDDLEADDWTMPIYFSTLDLS